MTPSFVVPPPGLRPQDLHRFHSFEAAPAVIRNTLVGANTITSLTPSWSIVTAGAVLEANKCVEIAVERDEYGFSATGPGFTAPGATNVFDFPIEIQAQMQFKVNNRANATVNTRAGIELGSASVVQHTQIGNSANIMLVQSAADYTAWDLVYRRGDAATRTVASFTVPKLAANPDVPEGHLVGIRYDPWGLACHAVVDGVLRATITFPGINWMLDNNILAGAIMFTGGEAVAVAHEFRLSAFRCTHFGTADIGSGLI